MLVLASPALARVNVVEIMTDDQTAASLQYMGNVNTLLGGDGTTFDQFALNFATLTVEYKPQDDKGGLGGAVTATLQGGC